MKKQQYYDKEFKIGIPWKPYVRTLDFIKRPSHLSIDDLPNRYYEEAVQFYNQHLFWQIGEKGTFDKKNRKLKFKDFEKAIADLEKADIPKFKNGKYVCLISPYLAHDLNNQKSLKGFFRLEEIKDKVHFIEIEPSPTIEKPMTLGDEKELDNSLRNQCLIFGDHVSVSHQEVYENKLAQDTYLNEQKSICMRYLSANEFCEYDEVILVVFIGFHLETSKSAILIQRKTKFGE